MSQKIFYKGQDSDFIVFVDSFEEYEKYKKDSSIPLSRFLGTFKVYESRTGGNEGILDEASSSQLENEFGTSDEEKVIKIILAEGAHKGDSKVGKKGWSSTNDSNGVRLG